MQPYIIYDKRNSKKFPDFWMKTSNHLAAGHIRNIGDGFIGRSFTIGE